MLGGISIALKMSAVLDFAWTIAGEQSATSTARLEFGEISMKFGAKTVTGTQVRPDVERYVAYRRKTAAFEEWRQMLKRNDRLPRGKFFKGKKPGRSLVVMDEFWRAKADEPYDLSQFKPFETIAFGQSPGVLVTAESLARFKVMEGLDEQPAASHAIMALAEAKASDTE